MKSEVAGETATKTRLTATHGEGSPPADGSHASCRGDNCLSPSYRLDSGEYQEWRHGAGKRRISEV